jgi:hypothetical protein
LEDIMLDFVGTVCATALIFLVVTSLVVFIEASRTAKLVLAGGIGLWVGLSMAASAAGWLTITRPFPVISLFVAAPLAAAAIAAGSPAARRALLGLPMPLLIGLNVGRVVAFLFLLLAANGRLAGPFPYSAAWGDIITGVLALFLIQRAGIDRSRLAILGWNLFGIADLVAAIALGIMSGEGSPLQVFHFAPGSAAMQVLPWSFVPTVLVPFYLIMHAIIAVQLSRHEAVSPSRRVPG